MTTRILHIIESLWLGGGARAMVACAKHSRLQGDFSHSVLPLRTDITSPAILPLLKEAQMEIVSAQSEQEIHALLDDYDIVQLQWWNNPQMDAFTRREDLPHTRMAAWFHVGGQRAPQMLSSTIVDYVDYAIPCSPYTYESPAIQRLSEDERRFKTAMAYGAADFDRVMHVTPKPHRGFTVGYIGTVDTLKMHPRFAEMSAAIAIPDARIIVCGSGGAEQPLRQWVAERNLQSRFEIRGHVDDICPVLAELDVYGYPLCEETYAAAEVNLQEVMFCGIPVVAFPYGGISRLIVNNYTGILVTSESEYCQAIEYLYHHPEERKRLGENAKNYAQQIFGAHNAARELNGVYAQMMERPKRYRSWGLARASTDRYIPVSEAFTTTALSGAARFIESLDTQSTPYAVSLSEKDERSLLEAEEEIRRCSQVTLLAGILPYSKAYPNDPYLKLWAGLGMWQRKDLGNAIQNFLEAYQGGISHWRVLSYLGLAAQEAGLHDLAQQALQQVRHLAPHAESHRLGC